MAIVEIVVAVGGNAAGFLRFDAGTVSAKLEAQGANTAILGALDDLTTADPSQPTQLTKAQALKLVERIEAGTDQELVTAKTALRLKVENFPTGTLTPDAVRVVRPMIDPMRRMRR